MPTSQIVYTVQTIVSGGQPVITVQGSTQQPPGGGTPGVPRDEQFLQTWGLRSSLDITTAAMQTVQRQITLQMNASVVATATATVRAGAPQGAIIGITITGQGMDYIRPPLLTITGNTGSGARFATNLQVLATASQVIGGVNYTAAATAVAQGGLVPGGVPATFSVTVVAGVITAVTCTNTATNGPYEHAPTIVITDPNNPTGNAQWIARMGVHPTVQIISGGDNYTAPATVAFVPFFKTLCPDTMSLAAQGAAVLGWMVGPLQQANLIPYFELAPVVT